MASTKSNKTINMNTKKSLNLIKNHVQTKAIKGKSNNGSLKRNQANKNVRQTGKNSGTGAKGNSSVVQNEDVEKIEKGDENGIEGEVSGANNFDDNNLDEEANDQEKTETKDSKESKESQEKFLETAMAKIRVDRLIKLRFVRRARDDGDSKKDETKDPPFRNFAPTGKYLHENDRRWCLRHTKLSSEKDILKWLKRFRTLCPKGMMNMDQLKEVYRKIFSLGGDQEFFCSEVMARFDVEEKNALDFKVFLYLVQISLLTTNAEKWNWVVQLMDLDDTGMVNVSEIENSARLFEELERRVRGSSLFELENEPDFDPLPTFDGLRQKPFEDRMLLMRNYLDIPEDATFISREVLSNMPIRHISSFWEDIEDNTF